MRMGAAAHPGWTGGLAVAFGVELAVLSGFGVASADPPDSSASDSSSSSSSASSTSARGPGTPEIPTIRTSVSTAPSDESTDPSAASAEISLTAPPRVMFDEETSAASLNASSGLQTADIGDSRRSRPASSTESGDVTAPASKELTANTGRGAPTTESGAVTSSTTSGDLQSAEIENSQQPVEARSFHSGDVTSPSSKGLITGSRRPDGTADPVAGLSDAASSAPEAAPAKDSDTPVPIIRTDEFSLPQGASSPVVVGPSAAEAADAIIEPTFAPQLAVSTATEREDGVEMVAGALASMATAFLGAFDDDASTVPLQSAAMWTLAAAARREPFGTVPGLDQAAHPVNYSTAAVVAIDQTPPLARLQKIPIIGPNIVTPLVARINQIPIISDALHPLLGYPLQLDLPAGTPLPRDVKVLSFDGAEIYVHFMPAVGLQAGQTAPTVLRGAGLGAPGSTNLGGTLFDDFFADAGGFVGVGLLRRAGYNVVTWDPRGIGNSGGQLELNSPDHEGRDVSAIISWLATQPEVRLDGPDDPRIGMVGPSYGGGIQLVAASIDERVDAIVPSVTYHSLSNAFYRNEAFRTAWGSALSSTLADIVEHMNPRIAPAAEYGALTGRMLQADLDLLAERNPVVDNITAPTLLIQGTVDTIFSLQEAADNAQVLIGNGVPTKMLWFCGGHGLCRNDLFRDGTLFDFTDGWFIQRRTLEWLDRYVRGDLSVSTGPQFEWVDQRGRWFSSEVYPVTAGTPIVTSGGAGALLPLIPYVRGSGLRGKRGAVQAKNAVNLTVQPASTTTYVVGAPELTLTYSGIGFGRNVYAQLVDDTTGRVLSDIVTPIPVTLDGQTHTITIALEPVAHTLAPGKTVTLQLVSAAGLYETLLPSLGALIVMNMQIALPTTDAMTASFPPPRN